MAAAIVTMMLYLFFCCFSMLKQNDSSSKFTKWSYHYICISGQKVFIYVYGGVCTLIESVWSIFLVQPALGHTESRAAASDCRDRFFLESVDSLPWSDDKITTQHKQLKIWQIFQSFPFDEKFDFHWKYQPPKPLNLRHYNDSLLTIKITIINVTNFLFIQSIKTSIDI